MPDKFDVIIIGAGVSGCIAAAYLAKGGLNTTVFESTGMIGGLKYGSYEVNGFRGDLTHLPVWCMGSKDSGWWLKAASETGAIIKWQCLPNMAFYMGGQIHKMPYCSNGKAFVDFVADLSPLPIPDETQQELAKIFDAALAIPEEILWSDEMDTMPFKTWIDSITEDELAKQLLAIMFAGMLCTPPEHALQKTSAQLVAGVNLAGLLGGRANLAGILGDTCDAIPKAFRDVAVEYGGQVLTNQRVNSVIIENGEAKSVVITDAGGREKTYEAKHIIISTGYPIYKSLLGENLPEGIKATTQQFDTMHFTSLDAHFGLKKKLFEPYWCHMNIMGNALEFKGLIASQSHFEPILAPKGKQLLQFQTFMPTADYRARTKEDWIQYAIDLIEGIFPGVRDEIEWTHATEVAPVFQYIFLPIPKIPLECPGISNLYFTGDCTQAPGPVTERAAASAMTVAKNILGQG